MRIIFLGDIVGRSGRDAVMAALPQLRSQFSPDAIIVNGENAASGFGITIELAQPFFTAGVAAITTGNHVWDQRPLIAKIDGEPRILRPLNYPPKTPGRGSILLTLADGRKLLVAQIMGRLFMDAMDDPFAVIEAEISRHRLGASVAAIFVDFHAEASSEKMAMAHFLDGRISGLVGTHTHIPTADAQILPGGTAYQTDAGMCGDYDSVIGMKKAISLHKFVRKMPTEKMSPAEGVATVCGVVLDTNDATGLATAIRPIRLGGRLLPTG
ncbi:MAG: TIGR00282 family metallophosphoesterase [Candidatus Pacebacteria bacterium]|nr:TIGR00282 family metallophosphoesterase [Candidatus Paceibacterota bacterium]